MITAAVLVGALSFGGGLGLLPTDPPPTPADGSPLEWGDGAAVPAMPPAPRPSAPIRALAAVAFAGFATLLSRPRWGQSIAAREGPGVALGLRPPPDMRVVFVPGHGDPEAAIVFRQLVEMTGIDPENVRWFDYRWVTGIEDHRLAARLIPVDVAARSLNSFLAGVAAEGHPVYVVGFSKGGATIAHLVAEWDRGLPGPSDAVVGTALLDPPIASGVTGLLQSLGRFWGAIPDDGGYDPISCTVMRIVCSDTRIGLGLPSGIEVIVIQNPKAGVTNVGTPPPGLRVVEAPDDGPTILGQLARHPALVPWRVGEAHRAVLGDPRVAGCLVAEMRSPGSCTLDPVPAQAAPAPAFWSPPWAGGP